jgi:hypothetical protein
MSPTRNRCFLLSSTKAHERFMASPVAPVAICQPLVRSLIQPPFWRKVKAFGRRLSITQITRQGEGGRVTTPLRRSA